MMIRPLALVASTIAIVAATLGPAAADRKADPALAIERIGFAFTAISTCKEFGFQFDMDVLRAYRARNIDPFVSDEEFVKRLAPEIKSTIEIMNGMGPFNFCIFSAMAFGPGNPYGLYFMKQNK